MFELIANLIFIGASALVDVKLYNTQDVDLPQSLGAAIPVMFREEGYNMLTIGTPPSEDGKCKYMGYVLPYERNWEEVTERDGQRTVIPPEPGKIASYAIVLNKKTCPDGKVESMFRVAERTGTLFNRGQMLKGYAVIGRQYQAIQADFRPKWVPQVMETLTALSARDPKVKAFLDYTAAEAEKALSAKQATAEPSPTKSD